LIHALVVRRINLTQLFTEGINFSTILLGLATKTITTDRIDNKLQERKRLRPLFSLFRNSLGIFGNQYGTMRSR